MKQEIRTYKVGDTIVWRGAWGTEQPKQVKIESIEFCKPNEKYGIQISQVKAVDKDRCVFVLNNGHWAYGNQIE